MSSIRVLATAALAACTMLVTAHAAAAIPTDPAIPPAPQLWVGQGTVETELPFVGGCRSAVDAGGTGMTLCADPPAGLGPTLRLRPDRELVLRFGVPVRDVAVALGDATVPPVTRVDDMRWTVAAGDWFGTSGNLTVSARDPAGDALYAGVAAPDPSSAWPGAGYALRRARVARGTLTARVSLDQKVTVVLSARLDGRRRARVAATLPAGVHTLSLPFPRRLTDALLQRGKLVVSYRRHGREISSSQGPFRRF